MNMMKTRCPHCGAESSGAGRFCKRCGKPLAAGQSNRGTAWNTGNVHSQPGGAFCRYCGRTVPAGAARCPNCGKQQPGAAKNRRTQERLTLAAIIGAPLLLTVVLLLVFLPKGGDVTVDPPPVTQPPVVAVDDTQPPTQPPTPTPTLTPTPTPTPTPKPTPKPGRFGYVEVGDTVTFGQYEQNNKTSDGKEPIEWIVIAKTGNKALLLSRYCLDAMGLNDGWVDTTWANCALRRFLNGTFLNAAFSESEKGCIIMTDLENHNNPIYGTYGGANTDDRVFVLSMNETEQYLSRVDWRLAKSTAYTMARGAHMNKETGYSWWWLRTPGEHVNYAVAVYGTGEIDSYGLYDRDIGAVRPALWVDLG